MSASGFESILAGRRVLFVNAIRSDIPSGGGTSTKGLLRKWQAAQLCEMRVLELNPPAGASRKLFSLLTMPAMLFVVLSRLSGHVWWEFFLRASPWLILRCWITRLRWQPEVVIFNHHASFIYSRAFGNCRRVLIWHDLPSLKRDGNRDSRRSARCCAWMERIAVAGADVNLTFSFDDARALRILHRCHAVVVSVIDTPASPRTGKPRPNHWLLVGNWNRAENREGGERFLACCARIAQQGVAQVNRFNVAGHGADGFVQSLRNANSGIAVLDIRVTDRFDEMRDFCESALLAPLQRGAGIKLKTIEAWAADIPVVGTAQAFSGMPARIWRLGGLRVGSIEEMAHMCMSGSELLNSAVSTLRPTAAYEAYHSELHASGAGAISIANSE